MGRLPQSFLNPEATQVSLAAIQSSINGSWPGSTSQEAIGVPVDPVV
jgi:hypothetical protein